MVKTTIGWRIYAKAPGGKRFRAMDYRAGTTVYNLIYATIWWADQGASEEIVTELVDAMTRMNAGWQFKTVAIKE